MTGLSSCGHPNLPKRRGAEDHRDRAASPDRYPPPLVTEQPPSPEADSEERSQLRELVLDDLGRQFDAFQALRKSDEAAADAVLENLGAQGDVERDIVLELSAPKPLVSWITELF